MKADVFYNDLKAGLLEKSDGLYRFTYDSNYLNNTSAMPISYSFPLQEETFESTSLFAFFMGLVSEGWLLHMQSRSQKIDENDYFALLLANGEDLIGATTVKPRVEK